MSIVNASVGLKEAWLFIGESGVGKSTLIQLFTPEKVDTSNSHKSCTKEIRHYQGFPQYGNLLLIDTIGFEDSRGISNEEVQSQVLKYIHDKKIENIKLAWICNGNIRMNQRLQRQAEFNVSFRESVCSSLLLIIKSVTPAQLSIQSKGAIESMKQHVSEQEAENIKKLSFKCVEFMEQAEKDEIESMQYTPKQKEILGIVPAESVKSLILDTMSQVQALQVLFLNQMCIKCGQIGDPRFLRKCHFGTTPVKYHPLGYGHKTDSIVYEHAAPPIPKHTGEMKNAREHNGQWVSVYNHRLEFYHRPHATILKRHHGYWNSEMVGRVAADIFSFGLAEFAPWGYWTCCNSRKQDDPGCQEILSCCEKSIESQGCQRREAREFLGYQWSCCGAKSRDAVGCQAVNWQVWDCCGAKDSDKNAECGKYLPCCDKIVTNIEDEKGCVPLHECCRQRVGETGTSDRSGSGCIFACCGQDRNAYADKGCQEKCYKCGDKWGDPKAPGCGDGVDYQHDMVDFEERKPDEQNEQNEQNEQDVQDVQDVQDQECEHDESVMQTENLKSSTSSKTSKSSKYATPFIAESEVGTFDNNLVETVNETETASTATWAAIDIDSVHSDTIQLGKDANLDSHPFYQYTSHSKSSQSFNYQNFQQTSKTMQRF